MSRKNVTRLTLLIIIAWLILPTGDPSDLFITAIIIEKMGMQGYLLLSVFTIFILYNSIEGRTLRDKLKVAKSEMARVIVK